MNEKRRANIKQDVSELNLELIFKKGIIVICYDNYVSYGLN